MACYASAMIDRKTWIWLVVVRLLIDRNDRYGNTYSGGEYRTCARLCDDEISNQNNFCSIRSDSVAYQDKLYIKNILVLNSHY